MKPFRIRKKPTLTPRRRSQPNKWDKWDESYAYESIPLYNALNDPH